MSNSTTSWPRAICSRPARPDEIGVSVSYPLPGTKFYDLVKAQMRGKTHWQESNDLDMMFQGTYTSDFYRAVRNLLHDQITLQIGRLGWLPDDGGAEVRSNGAGRNCWPDELKYRSSSERSAASA